MSNKVFEDVWNEEKFSPKEGKDPKREKWRDAKRARNQMLWITINRNPRPPHENFSGLTENGLPYFPSNYTNPQGRIKINVEGFNRPRWARRERHRNGKKEWGADRDAWGKPFIQDKSSRQRMREKQEWQKQAAEALEEEGF